MPEQLTLVDVPPQLPVTSPYSAYQTLTSELTPGGDVYEYTVRTDFRALDKAHKASFVPKTEATSAYVDLVPDINSLPPKPDWKPLSTQQREQIINEGTIPEVMPFMAGARVALAERRARRQHQKTQSARRRAHVAYNVAENSVSGKDYSAPENEYRPRTLREKAMAKRMGRLVTRANHHNASANIIEDMYAYPGSSSTPAGEEQTIGQVDFDRHKENLSIFEKLHRRSERKLYARRREQSNRVIHGYRIPVVGKRIGLLSFDSLATGGPGNPIKKAATSLEKRDKTVLKAAALRRQQAANEVDRQAIRDRKYHALWGSAEDIADSDRH